MPHSQYKLNLARVILAYSLNALGMPGKKRNFLSAKPLYFSCPRVTCFTVICLQSRTYQPKILYPNTCLTVNKDIWLFSTSVNSWTFLSLFLSLRYQNTFYSERISHSASLFIPVLTHGLCSTKPCGARGRCVEIGKQSGLPILIMAMS